MNSQRGDAQKINLIEEGKKIGIDEVIKRSEIINDSLKLFRMSNIKQYHLVV